MLVLWQVLLEESYDVPTHLFRDAIYGSHVSIVLRYSAFSHFCHYCSVTTDCYCPHLLQSALCCTLLHQRIHVLCLQPQGLLPGEPVVHFQFQEASLSACGEHMAGYAGGVMPAVCTGQDMQAAANMAAEGEFVPLT